MWPMVLDNTRDECKRSLRRYELEAYSAVVTALRAQGDLNKDKRKILQDLSSLLSISLERHRAEVRRAANDERLNTIAHHMSGANTSTEWTIEGRRLIPLLPRLVPQTAFTGLANTAANIQNNRNQSMLSPSETGVKHMDTNQGQEDSFGPNTPKRRRIDSQSQSSFGTNRSNSVCEPIVLQNSPSLQPNHRNTHPLSKVSASSSRPVVNTTNCYTVTTNMSQQQVGHSGTRVIFVSTPTTSPSNVMTTSSAKNLTAIPLISRHTLSSPQKPVIDVPPTRPIKQRPGRPVAVNPSIVGLIGVSGAQTNQKQTKSVSNKMTINTTNVSLAANVTRIPFISGTQVFTKSNGQQQVVVFPVNSRQPVSVPISQTVKAISIPSSSPSVTTNAPTFIYQTAPNMKNVQKVQAPNLIIMQQKQIIQTSRPLTSIPTTAITLSKANIAKTQVKGQIYAPKPIKQLIDIGPSHSQTINLCENPKIITKRLQTSPKFTQEISASLPDLAQRGVIGFEAPPEALGGFFNNVRSVPLTHSNFFELIQKASSGQTSADIHDSSSEDTVSTSESPLHEMQSDFEQISDNTVCAESVKTNKTNVL